MTSIAWTDEQKKAIATRGGNLLVSAAAGSGKTAVLVERIIRILLDEKNPVDMDKLLVVTFTDAAAGEMRYRVQAALAQELQKNPRHPLLQRQLFLAPRAQISTLHSFCSEVLRSNFYLLGLDPAFRVMDQHEMELLRRETVENVLEQFYEEYQTEPTESDFIYLSRTFAGRHGDDGQLVHQVLRLYDFAHSMPRPVAWLNSLAPYLECCATQPWDKQPWLKHWQDIIRLEIEGWLTDLKTALKLTSEPGGPIKYADVLQQDIARISDFLPLVQKPIETLANAMTQNQKWPTLPRTTKNDVVDEELKKKVQTLRDGVKKSQAKLQKQYFNRPATDMLGDLAKAVPMVRALVEVTLKFKEVYQALKLERAVVDFTDLEYGALAILALNGEGSPYGEPYLDDPNAPMLPSPVAQNYQATLAEVLVDEYQDTNSLQEAILQLVSRPDNRFLVGDVKQSIYRFRLADPTLFINFYQKFLDLDTGFLPQSGWRLDLQTNFRSRTPVLATANYLFERLMNQRVAELTYDNRARLNPGASFPIETEDLPVEIHLLDFDPPANENDSNINIVKTHFDDDQTQQDVEQEDLNLLQLEARFVAQKIQRLVMQGDTMVLDRASGQTRPVTWRDIVVLMRSLKGRVGIYLEEFRRLGIPVYADGSGGYFGAFEVQTMVSLLQIIDNPLRDIPLVAVLRSQLVGLSAADLANIRLASPGSDFYSAVQNLVQHHANAYPQLAARLDSFLNDLNGWRDLAAQVAPAELLEELYRQTNYYDLVGSLPGGVLRQANLRALVDRARKFDGTVYRGLFRFLRFVELLQERDGDMDTARSLGEKENVVRLLSIHKSKGLEFPVVVLTGLGWRFNLMDLNQRLLLHRRLGCGPQVVDLEQGIRYETVLYRVLRQKMQLESLAEEMRLLYVAFTRAKEYLIATAALRDLKKEVDNWAQHGLTAPPSGPLGASLLAKARRPVDWLGPALWSHPQLAGYDFTGDHGDGATDHWQVFLWQHEDLAPLWQQTLPQEQYMGQSDWLRYVTKLEPIPDAVLNQMEQKWTGAPLKLLNDQILQDRLFWRYPYPALAALPSKVTVTQWRHRQEQLDDLSTAGLGWSDLFSARPADQTGPSELELPVFYTGDRYDGAEKGRVVHLAMQNLVLSSNLDETNVRQQLDNLVEKQILCPRRRQLVRAAEIANFFDTSLGQRLLKAAQQNKLWREVSFTIGVDVTELYPQLADQIPSGEQLLLQGTIDCLWLEQDSLVVLDYKTDYVRAEDLSAKVENYRIQLDLYARAATALMGYSVSAKYIYFFHLNKFVLL